ncbi:sigma-70 family RNA polymerase sigma factor [Cucumibacter marinus]|uniref:sigma-70 family RNA polymerase sigma factor n=1 Tax=Cucumibacter marinus TaxID=1121252 RepID=UPI000403B665|nr:sigma-70 family RNA polymerase sigma factor [Cucumibacter marinus]
MSTEEISDLIKRVSLRDRRAFSALYDRTSAKLFGVCLRILRSRAEAEEAMQEVYIKIWQRADRYVPGRNSPISWLAAIARNHAIDVVRARKPVADGIDAAVDLPDDGPGPEQAAIMSGEAGRLGDCLGKLDQNKAEAVVSAYMEGYSYQELADRHAIPLNTMRTWLRRSLIQLRECLER